VDTGFNHTSQSEPTFPAVARSYQSTFSLYQTEQRHFTRRRSFVAVCLFLIVLLRPPGSWRNGSLSSTEVKSNPHLVKINHHQQNIELKRQILNGETEKAEE